MYFLVGVLIFVVIQQAFRLLSSCQALKDTNIVRYAQDFIVSVKGLLEFLGLDNECIELTLSVYQIAFMKRAALDSRVQYTGGFYGK